MSKLFVSEHPLIHTKMAMLRDEQTGTKEFREIIGEVASLLLYEATRDLPLKEVQVKTPIATATCKTIDTKLAMVPILRAGLGMTDGLLNLLPAAKIGHIGLYRDETTLEPVEYYCKLPLDIEERTVFLTDPMLATGGSADAAIGFLKARGVKNIIFLCILAATEGVERLQKNHPGSGFTSYRRCGRLRPPDRVRYIHAHSDCRHHTPLHKYPHRDDGELF